MSATMSVSWLSFFSLCLVMAVRVQSQLQYNRVAVQDHGYMYLNDLAADPPLQCTTAVSSCCSGSSHGTWVRPDGVNVTTSTVRGVRQDYRTLGIDLYVTNSAMIGIYRCDIQTNDNSDDKESYYVGIYPTQTGSVNVTTITLTVESANRFTFTCISVDGPVADVYWRYYSNNLGSGGKVLNDSMTARYTLTKTVSPLRTGRYSCSISTDNVHNSNDNSKSLDIRGGLNDMSVSRIGLSTIRVTWHANWSNRLTRSHIYYQRLGSSVVANKSIDWWDNSTDIGGLTGGAGYSIYIAHTESSPNTVRAAAKVTLEFITIIISSSVSYPTVGDRVTLTCSLTLPTGVTGTLVFKWKKPSGTVQYSYHSNSYGRVSNRLILNNIAPSDVGKYTCTASLSGSVSTNTTIPSLQIPSPTVYISPSRSGTLYAGTNFTFTCILILGYSIRSLDLSVNISWSGLPTSRYFISDTLPGSNGRYTRELTISPLTISDSGTHSFTTTVSGTNISSRGATANIHLSVTDLPYPRVAISGVSIGTAGRWLQLRCTVRVVDHLVVDPSVWWTGGSVGGSSGVIQSTTSVSGIYSTRTLTFSPLQTSHGNEYTCVTEIHINAIRLTISNNRSRNVAVLIPSPVVTVTVDDTEILSDYPLSLSCSISPLPSVDTSTTFLFVWTTPNGPGRVREVNDTREDMLVIPHTRTGDTGRYSCSVTVFDSSDSPFISDNRSSSHSVNITVKLTAIISADYTPVPGEDPEKLRVNEFTAGSVLVLKCTLEGSTEDMSNSYQWSMNGGSSFMGCTECNKPTLIVGGPPLYSVNAGNYTCTINKLTSRPFIFSVVGAGMYVESSSSSPSGGPVASNGVVVSSNSGLRLECVSNSSRNGLGTVTTPAGITLTPPTNTSTWNVSGPASRPGLLAIDTFSPISPSQQGIYTCIIPDSNGNDIILNVGIYPHGFKDGPMIVDMRYINYKEGCGQVICVSSGSPATRVMWSENGKPLDTDLSLSYSFFQVVTERTAAVYSNVLVVRDLVVGSNYSCTVTNDLGSSSMDIIVDSECETWEFSAEAGERQVTFSWCPPDDDESNCSLHTPAFNLSCSPSLPSLTHPTLEPGTSTLAGFFPNTQYNCSVAKGARPLARASFTTMEDYSELSIPVFFDRNDSNYNCSMIRAMGKVNILKLISDWIVEQLKTICPDCNSSSIDRQTIDCVREFPPLITYAARLAGTHENDSDNLVTVLEKMAGEGRQLHFDDVIVGDSRSTMDLVVPAVGIAVGLVTLVVVMAVSLVLWRWWRAFREKRRARQLGMDELPRPEREPGEVKNTVRDYSYVKVEKIDNKEPSGGKSIVIDTNGDGPIVIPDDDKPATIATGVATTTGEGSPRNGSPIDTKGNTAYLPVAPHGARVGDSKYVEMPSRQIGPQQPSGGRQLAVTGITTAPNAAYYEISIEKEDMPLPLRPSEPLYESVGDFAVWKDRAKRGVHQLIRSLPRYMTPPTSGKFPRLPSLHTNRAQTLPRVEETPPKATPIETPPQATLTEAPPNPEDSPTRNRPPAPLPPEAQESDEEDDAYVYERVVNHDETHEENHEENYEEESNEESSEDSHEESHKESSEDSHEEDDEETS